ncbi:chaperone protein dnaJ 11, chloroplastic-like [Carica papaya]|uniref:chaperone protein dnaJ 11, chloroplastic-like n=1 Tax=Carica papaya TaxID=3649 RepID=UPI000B8D0944|nr:chaperone protein dnaJ 11, chloroplastic-like [Carica papaya]
MASSLHLIPQNVVVVSNRRSLPTSASFRPRPVSATSASTAQPTRPLLASSPPSSLYEVLGIQMGATCKEIKIAYRKLARTLHPDVAGAASEFIRVHEAYATLSNPDKRADYDRALFRRRRPMVWSHANAATRSSGRGRKWETDQCW